MQGGRPRGLPQAGGDGPVTSLDLELRPAGAEPVSVARLLAPRVLEYINGLDDPYRALRRLLESDDDLKVGAAASKLADLCTRILTIAGQRPDTSAAREIRSQQDVPSWDHLGAEDRARVEQALATLDAILGDEWYR